MNYLTPIISFLLAAAAASLAWVFARSYERRVQEMKISAIETKLQAAQVRSNQLNDQLVKTQHEVYVLNTSLEKERKEHSALIADYSRPFRKKNVWLAVLPLMFGLVFGGFFAAYRSDTVYLSTLTELKVTAKVASVKTQFIESRLREIETDLKLTRQALQQEMEARIVAETKLAMITGEMPKVRKNLAFPFFSTKKESGSIKETPALPIPRTT